MSDNFNYISIGDTSYVADLQEDISMIRGRMFEYTPTDIEKRVEDLGPAAIDFIEKLPTFLCSEIKNSPESYSMIIRYGHIHETTVGGREVATKFTTVLDFGEVEFQDVAQAKEIFGATGFQLYRTHWAIRDGDARDVLERLAHSHLQFRDSVAQYLTGSTGVDAEPPPREKNIIGTADSVEAFLQHIYALPVDPSVEYFFRGHEDPSFEFTPSLLRKSPSGDWQFLQNEDRIGKELLIAHYDEFQSDHFCFDRLVRMQHYGLPTRLLDISSNPLVALFFACYGNGNLPTGDGEMIIFKIMIDKIKYYDSDTVSCIIKFELRAEIENRSFSR